MVINIEIQQSPWKKDSWCIRVGDIAGSSESSNISKKELIAEIRKQLKMEVKLNDSLRGN
jgi:hypothetical protein